MAMPTAAAALLQPSTVSTRPPPPPLRAALPLPETPLPPPQRGAGDIRNGAAARQGAEVRVRNAEASAPVAAAEVCGRQEPAAAPAVKILVTFYQFSVVIGSSQVNKSEAF